MSVLHPTNLTQNDKLLRTLPLPLPSDTRHRSGPAQNTSPQHVAIMLRATVMQHVSLERNTIATPYSTLSIPCLFSEKRPKIIRFVSSTAT